MYLCSWDERGYIIGDLQSIDKNNYSINYAYDKADHLNNIRYPSGNQISSSEGNTPIFKSIIK